MKVATAATILACLASGVSSYSFSQAYPVKPIRIVVAQAAGSTTDLLSRMIGQRLSEALGQPVLTENRPGGGGINGTESVARAPADGHTLLMGNNSTHGANTILYKNLPYDAVKDFAPVTLTGATPFVLTVHPSLPVASVKQLIALAKLRPGDINYGSAGNGSSQHLCGELLKALTGIEMVHVAYKGGAPAIMGLSTGEVSVMFPTVTLALNHIKSNRVKPLAVTTTRRSTVLSELPTLAETGLPEYDMISWFGLLAPAGIPQTVLARLNSQVVQILNEPEMKNGLAKQGLEALSGSPGQFAQYIRDEITKTSRIAKAAGIKPE